jgi:cytochrome c-type biogenesis protein CcmH/NrfF
VIRTWDMSPAEFLEGFLPRWQAGLSPRLTPFVDRFLRLHRGVLLVLAQRALARLRARRGELPDTVIEFAAFDPVVAHERILSSRSDDAVLRQLRRRIDERRARGESEADVLARFVDPYVAARTQAILLWYAGWDAVPLMLARPALAVAISGVVVAVRDMRGKVSLHPLESDELARLENDFKKAETRATYLIHEADQDRSTADEFLRFAGTVWGLARLPPPPWVATPRPRIP